MMPHRIRFVLPLAVAAVMAAATLPSCAYFNTLYNARKLFREAEKTEQKGGDERAQRDKYKEVVQKCAQMIQDFPKSRWVDDAEFLMGRAFIKQGEYDKAIRKFLEILSNFPKSGYVPESIYWLAHSYYEKKENTQALVYTDQFLKEYPKHELRYEVMFLAGDINRELENDDAALGYYGRVAEEAKKKEVIDQARLKSAELFKERGDWEKAAAGYEKVLRKGLAWADRYTVSLALGECYTHIGKGREALLLYEGLLKQSTSTKETPPLMLGQAASFMSMDSIPRAMQTFSAVSSKYPKSVFSATAYYQMGLIYSDKLDSLQAAQRVFSKVGEEDANYEYAQTALERSNSLKRLIELQKAAGAGQTADQAAEKRFMAAEIQLTRLDNVPLALQGYGAVLDSFPQTRMAPRAAYAIGWVYERKLNEREKAIDAFRTVAERYPRSPQARGALSKLESLGAVELRDRMKAHVDSALADTLSVPEPSAAPSKAAPSSTDTSRAAGPGLGPRVPADTSRAAPPGALPPGAAPAVPPDTSGSRIRQMIPSMTDTSGAPIRQVTPVPGDTAGLAAPQKMPLPASAPVLHLQPADALRDTSRLRDPGSGVVPPVLPDTSGAGKKGGGG